MEMIVAKKIIVKGIVQGVGFRPFIYKNAVKNNLMGFVNNTSKGVFIEVEGHENKINSFINEIREKPPVLSKVTDIKIIDKEIEGFKNFKIIESIEEEEAITLISPDIAICNDCIKDISDKNNRRYRYPFTNCTNCGPRFSIVEKVPYDRGNTTMNIFEMCSECRKEYTNPLDRRFHAQPNACFKCGPRVFICDDKGKEIITNDPIRDIAKEIKHGKIVAIKGIGGFHLACDAENKEVINELRKRKKRPRKPLAVMMKDIDTVKKYCNVNKLEESILLGNKKPILLLDKKRNSLLPKELTNYKNGKLGVMLPYTPVHHILFSEDIDILVMTSANISGEPMVYKNDEAIEKLKGIVDFYLMNNRDIYMPIDDSVSRVILGKERVIRNARGYAPKSIETKDMQYSIALGSNSNNTFTIANNENIFLSNYIGDLTTYNTCQHYINALEHMKRIYNINPKSYFYDLHLNFYQNELLKEIKARKIGIQHHHAHIVACIQENFLEGEVIGVAFDGTGYGTDGKLWGGEFFICDKEKFKRLAHINYISLPGGEGAIKEPWKMAISYLYDIFKEDYFMYLPKHLQEKKHKIITEIIKKDINSPKASSIGRLFDAVAALLGFDDKITFQGEAAIYLENISVKYDNKNYEYKIYCEQGSYIIDCNVLIKSIVTDIINGVDKDIIAKRFHNTIIKFTIELCEILRKEYDLSSVVLSGGVFQNEILLINIYEGLIRKNFNVYIHEQIPANDEGISIGQMIIGNEILKKELVF
ncbi:MAG: carbamoyltransferase HypF [Clostridium sp.]|nr:carbamoyltransferase HypF [Clostridium sp.]